MSPVLTPEEEIAAIIEGSNKEPPQVCHTIDARGWAYCGAFKSSRSGGTHSEKACKAAGHRQCVICEELCRQLGDERIMA